MDKTIRTEAHIHGRAWQGVHGGYFSDGKNARPLLRALAAAAKAAAPDVVADLGGGTGFILSRLARMTELEGARLINVDASCTQLSETRHQRVECLSCKAQDMSRKNLCPSNKRLLLTMRSVLHYCGGAAQQEKFLMRLRAIARPGEYLVHQSACFQNIKDVRLMNGTYRLMHSAKRYPTEDGLAEMLCKCGWEVESREAVAPMTFDWREMRERYHLSGKDIFAIAKAAEESDGDCVQAVRGGFTGRLEYSLFTCRAI